MVAGLAASNKVRRVLASSTTGPSASAKVILPLAERLMAGRSSLVTMTKELVLTRAKLDVTPLPQVTRDSSVRSRAARSVRLSR